MGRCKGSQRENRIAFLEGCGFVVGSLFIQDLCCILPCILHSFQLTVSISLQIPSFILSMHRYLFLHRRFPAFPLLPILSNYFCITSCPFPILPFFSYRKSLFPFQINLHISKQVSPQAIHSKRRRSLPVKAHTPNLPLPNCQHSRFYVVDLALCCSVSPPGLGNTRSICVRL